MCFLQSVGSNLCGRLIPPNVLRFSASCGRVLCSYDRPTPSSRQGRCHLRALPPPGSQPARQPGRSPSSSSCFATAPCSAIAPVVSCSWEEDDLQPGRVGCVQGARAVEALDVMPAALSVMRLRKEAF